MKIISSGEKKRILKRLKEQYGISKLPFLLLRFGKEKIRGYSGSLSKEELNILDKNVRVENIGIYLGKLQDNEIRLSLDAIHLLKGEISKNILEVTEQQAEDWFSGKYVELENQKEGKDIPREFFVLKHEGEFIGCGKSTGELIKNYMPKERRVKS